jgi:hypothetical protein
MRRSSSRPQQSVSAPGWEEPSIGSIYESNGEAVVAIDDQLHEEGLRAAGGHQIGGWPILQQGPIWVECELASNGIYVGSPDGYQSDRAIELRGTGAKDWVLLLQIESADVPHWMWSDGGTLYFTIRRSDIAEGRLERSWMVSQSG